MNLWAHLSARERGGVVLAGVVVVLAVYYLGVWSPVQEDIAIHQKRIAQLETDYKRILQAEAELRFLEGEPIASGKVETAAPGVSLLAEVDGSLQRAGLAAALREIKPDGEEIVRVSLGKSSFNKVVLWLEYLHSSGIEVDKADFNADAEPGHVQLTVQLRDQRM